MEQNKNKKKLTAFPIMASPVKTVTVSFDVMFELRPPSVSPI